MNFHVLTLFPEMIVQGLNTSIIGRAINENLLHINAIDIRDFTNNKHKKVDDYPYGGGAGMVMQAQPIYDAYKHVMNNISNKTKGVHNHPRTIYVTPQGKLFNNELAKTYAKEENLIILCGHYEGVDERALDLIVTDFVSIGDYVLTGGELPAMVMIDAISRYIPNVLNNDESSEFESLENNLLEHPQYTRPYDYMDMKVPEVLLSGHHENIEKWRREESIKRTLFWRPELLEKANLTNDELKYLEIIKKSLIKQDMK